MNHHVHRERPSCFTDGEPTERGQKWLGHRAGKRPGWRNAFTDSGRACMNAQTPELWAFTTAHTPACRGCSRAARSLALWAAGMAS